MFDSFISSSTVSAIKEAMIPVAEKIGNGAEYVWVVLVKQMFVQGFGWAVAGIAAMVLCLVAVKLVFWSYEVGKPLVDKQTDSYYSTKGNGYMAICVISTIASVVLFGLASVFAYFAIAHFINPDFYAIKFLIDAVRPAAN